MVSKAQDEHELRQEAPSKRMPQRSAAFYSDAFSLLPWVRKENFKRALKLQLPSQDSDSDSDCDRALQPARTATGTIEDDINMLRQLQQQQQMEQEKVRNVINVCN